MPEIKTIRIKLTLRKEKKQKLTWVEYKTVQITTQITAVFIIRLVELTKSLIVLVYGAMLMAA